MSESLESLKKQVIARLKELDQKEESKQLKKAIEYFSNSECLVNHLEKSISGEWIEKAGYGVGTIRVWKGKKYKKVSSSPVKWVRVFDKMDRGAKSSMTRLIHKVQACNSEDELYQFCLSHHALFQDENGVDLPIMDKLRAAIDEKKNGTQNIAKPIESKKNVDYSKMTESELANLNRELRTKMRDKGFENTEEEEKQVEAISRQRAINFYKVKEKHTLSHMGSSDQKEVIESGLSQTKKDIEKKEKQLKKLESADKHDLSKMNKVHNEIIELKYKQQAYEQLEKEFVDYVPKTEKEKTTKEDDNIKGQQGAVAMLKNQMGTWNKEKLNDYLNEKLEKLNSGKVTSISVQNVRNQIVAARELLKEKFGDTEKPIEDNHYWIQDSRRNRLTNESAKKRIKASLDEIDKIKSKLDSMDKADQVSAKRDIHDLEYDINNLMDKLNSDDRKEMKSEQEKHQNRSDAMKGNDNAKKDNAKPTITFDRKGKLGEKAVNTKLGTDNIKALDALPEKFDDDKRIVLKYPSEVEIDGEKKLAYTNGRFLVVTHDIPANGVKTKQSEKIQGDYPNVEKVIPKEFKDNSAPKVDINIDQVMKDLPKVDFSKKAFNDDSHKQFMKIGNFWYDAKMVKATYDMLKGDNAEVLESKDTYSDGRFGRLCIKTDKGYSVIVSLSNDYAENYKKQSIYNSDEGSMSASAKAEYESRKKTGLPDTYVNNAIEFGYQIDNKGFIHGEDKDITFKGKGENTEFYYKGIPTGIKNKSSYMYGTKENIQSRIDAVKKQIENNLESYKEGKKNPANKPANYDATFPNMTDKDLTDIYKWWSNPKNIEEAIYKNSYKTKVPGLGSYGNDARKIGVVEDRVMDMLPDIKKEIARRGISIKKSLDGELIFESSIESYVKKSISILKKSLIG